MKNLLEVATMLDGVSHATELKFKLQCLMDELLKPQCTLSDLETLIVLTLILHHVNMQNFIRCTTSWATDTNLVEADKQCALFCYHCVQRWEQKSS